MLMPHSEVAGALGCKAVIFNHVASEGFSCHRRIKVQSEGGLSPINASTDFNVDAFQAGPTPSANRVVAPHSSPTYTHHRSRRTSQTSTATMTAKAMDR